MRTAEQYKTIVRISSKIRVNFFCVHLQLTIGPSGLLFYSLLWLIQYLEGYITFPLPLVDQILVLVVWKLLLIKLVNSLLCR